MIVHLLLSVEQVNSIPGSIKILQDYGQVSICDSNGKHSFTGQHVLLECQEDELKTWIFNFPSFWVGKGSPILQQFELFSKE